MWKCHKCGKPVYFAERKQSLGYDWHPECLRCEECGKRLNPGQHAEHKGVPYCHVPCYGALFGPQLFGHGTRVESHKSFGKGAKLHAPNTPALPRDHLESKLKVYNQYYDNKSMEIRSREVNNRLILEGALRVYWGVQGVIHLKEDDDQRFVVVRKRNSCRVSKGEESLSDKENDGSESLAAPSTTSDVEALSTDISLSESMTFDSCSLNDFDLPTTPEDVSANTTGTLLSDSQAVALKNGQDGKSETTDSSRTLCALSETSVSNSCASSTLPSKLDNLEKQQWDEFDQLLQVERRLNEKDKIYETMPVRLPSSNSSSTESSPTKSASAQNSTESTVCSTNGNNSSSTTTSTNHGIEEVSNNADSISTSSATSSSSTTTTSSDNFLTATTSINSTANTANDVTDNSITNADNYETSDDATLKPMDFEEFRRSVHLDYVSGANSFQEPNENTLKRNQPIDPSRIHDSLKLYGENSIMSKSFNCEHALRSIDPLCINDTLTMKSGSNNGSPRSAQRIYALQKSGSAHCNNQQSQHGNNKLRAHGKHIFERGINRSKSGPSCFDYSDSDDDDDDATLKPHATVRRSDVPPRFIQIQMNCYEQKSSSAHKNSEADDSLTQSDELTQTESVSMVTAANGAVDANNEEQPLHITEDGVVLRRPLRTGAAAIKRRSGNRRSRTKLKRRCSINGHYYNRETSFFTPPYGSQMSVWVTSLVTTQEVINLVLEKYKVDSSAENFSLFIVQDNGEQKRLKENDYPLIVRVLMGPHEEVSRLFLVDSRKTDEISNEVAQFLNLSEPECRAILERYDLELEREANKVKEKYAELRRRIVARMESLKVHL